MFDAPAVTQAIGDGTMQAQAAEAQTPEARLAHNFMAREVIMAIPHASPGQVIDVLPLAAQLPQAKTRALFKSEHLEVIHLVLLAGKSLPPHKVAGEITIQCLEGEMLVTLDDGDCALRPGQMVYLQGGAMHAVLAVRDATALVTIALVASPGA